MKQRQVGYTPYKWHDGLMYSLASVSYDGIVDPC